MINFLANKKLDYARIQDILSVSESKNHYTNDGPVKRLLEKKLEEILEIDEDKCVVCVSNGTTALHTLMFLCEEYLDVNSWVVPAFTFPSPVVGTGCNVSILDIEYDTYTLDFDQNKLHKFDGIVLTNLFGSYVDLYKWQAYCDATGKILIFDNASSPLSKCNGVNICNFGDCSFGSLHHTKYLGCGEGGFVVVPKQYYDKVLSIVNFGFYFDRKHKKLSSNFKMSDVSAAFILCHIENYNIDKHKEVQNKLVNMIKSIDGVNLFNYKPGTVYNNFPVLFDQPIGTEAFDNSGIVVHKYYEPLKSLPFSNMLFDHIINFPLNNEFDDNNIDCIIDAIDGIVVGDNV